jgi:protein NirF
MRALAWPIAVAGWLVAASSGAGGIGSRVFVVERASGSLAIYDLESQSSIDNAISQDCRFIATAEYAPGGVTILDARNLQVLKRHRATQTRGGEILPSRVTGIVDAPGNRFVCVLMEGAEIWVIDGSKPDFPIAHRIPTPQDMPYDAMITPDGRYYAVGHLHSDRVSVLDLTRPEAAVREISLRDPNRRYDRETPVKLPHMASWAVAGRWVFVPLVGEKRLAVLDRQTWAFERSLPLRGHPVYAVRSPTEREVWVSFSGEEDDAYVQIVDVERLALVDTLEVGGRIYHMDFTPRGSHVLVSANRDDKLFLVNASTRRIEDVEEVKSPSGIFGVWRAFRIGL